MEAFIHLRLLLPLSSLESSWQKNNHYRFSVRYLPEIDMWAISRWLNQEWNNHCYFLSLFSFNLFQSLVRSTAIAGWCFLRDSSVLWFVLFALKRILGIWLISSLLQISNFILFFKYKIMYHCQGVFCILGKKNEQDNQGD